MVDFIAAKFDARLTSEWISYNVRIGSAGQSISPTYGKCDWTAPEGRAPDEEMKLRFFITLIAGYRYGFATEITQGDYKSNVLGKINQVVRNEPFNLDSDLIPTEMARCKTWYNNQEFQTLIAALDVFWCKFPDSKGVKLRVCTLNSRFKDCSSISELRHLSQISARKIGDILQCVFSVRVRDEIEAIGKEGEEFEKEDSYFPYMRGMRLSKRSPYSSTENVHLHNWISTFSALLESERSFNARVVSESGLVMSLNLAIFAAYAFIKYANPQIVFGSQDSAEAARTIATADDGDSTREFTTDPASPLLINCLL